MRTIKFRGKDSNGEWKYGSLTQGEAHNKNGEPFMVSYIAPSIPVGSECGFELVKMNRVIPATIGQFTGLTDKNGKEIYEGDIVQWGDSEHKIKQVVEFRNGAFGYVYDTIGSFVPYAANTNFDFAALGTDKRFEVIGNIHNNPELIEKGGEK